MNASALPRRASVTRIRVTRGASAASPRGRRANVDDRVDDIVGHGVKGAVRVDDREVLHVLGQREVVGLPPGDRFERALALAGKQDLGRSVEIDDQVGSWIDVLQHPAMETTPTRCGRGRDIGRVIVDVEVAIEEHHLASRLVRPREGLAVPLLGQAIAEAEPGSHRFGGALQRVPGPAPWLGSGRSPGGSSAVVPVSGVARARRRALSASITRVVGRSRLLDSAATPIYR